MRRRRTSSPSRTSTAIGRYQLNQPPGQRTWRMRSTGVISLPKTAIGLPFDSLIRQPNAFCSQLVGASPTWLSDARLWPDFAMSFGIHTAFRCISEHLYSIHSFTHGPITFSSLCLAVGSRLFQRNSFKWADGRYLRQTVRLILCDALVMILADTETML